MKTRTLLVCALAFLSTGALISCSDDDEENPPAAGKGGTAGKGGSAGKSGSAGTGGVGKGGSAGSTSGTSGNAGSSSGGRAGGGTGGVSGSTGGGIVGGEGGLGGEGGGGAPAGAGGEGGEGGIGGVSGDAGQGGVGGTGRGGEGGTPEPGGPAGSGGEGGAETAPPAVLKLSEINANINGGADLIELRVATAGDIFGITLQQAVATPVILATLPHLTVAMGDLLVVHLNAPGGVMNETTAVDQCTGNACFDEAWDVRGADVNIVYSNRVISVRANGAYQDAVPFVVPAGTAAPAFPGDLQAIQAAGQWTPADCGGDDCTYDTTPSAEDIAVDWTDTGTTAAGDSVRRIGADNDSASPWSVGASSFGQGNN